MIPYSCQDIDDTDMEVGGRVLKSIILPQGSKISDFEQAMARKIGILPKVVISVYLAGNSCDMQAIHELARQYGFSILEDASHALGATHWKRPVGCCGFIDAAIFSSHACMSDDDQNRGVVASEEILCN